MLSSLDKERTLKPRVFVSHSHKDEVYARKIVSWLSKVGFEPWASFEECSDKYRVEIDSALLACNIFLLVASKDSFSSVEVRREINVAGSSPMEKPIAYYKLDGSSHLREGFLTLLSEKQYIQASRSNLELGRLAEYLFEIWDGNANEQVRMQRGKLIRDRIASEEESYLKWKDKLWNLRLDANNNPRKLSLLDRDILQNEADRLGIIVSIDDENQSFSLNKTAFQRDLIGIVAKRRIDVSMASQIEMKRLECSVSKELAVAILNKRLEKIDYLDHLSMTKSASKLDHWLVLEIKKIQSKRSGSSLKDKVSGTSFTFRDLIWPLEYYVNGACEIKMDVMSLSYKVGAISFKGLQGRRPFTFSASAPISNIATGQNRILIDLDGHETRIILRLDTTSPDYNDLLQFIASTLGWPIASLGAERILAPRADIDSAIQQNASQAGSLEHETSSNSEGSSEPDFLFYTVIFLLLLAALGLRKLF